MNNFIKSSILIFLVFFCFACKRKENKKLPETRTSGNLQLLVDESVAPVIEKEIEIFKLDYPKANIKVLAQPELKLIPGFLNDSTSRVIILPRLLSKTEEEFYKRKDIKINSIRFAIDGIALIVNKDNIDSNITVNEVIDILKGKKSDKKLVFDNIYSSTFQYLKNLAKIDGIPSQNVYAKSNSKEVIQFIAENKNFIGLIGVNWFLDQNNNDLAASISKLKCLGVKGKLNESTGEEYYKPTQYNLINGLYPLIRNINIIDCEGNGGLGTGFATWLRSQRGQLIVLKSGLGPHKLMPRTLNIKSKQ